MKTNKLFFYSILILSYIFVEWVYNQHLLILLSYDKINPQDFQLTEIFGKCIASFGLNLVINNFLKKFLFLGLFLELL